MAYTFLQKINSSLKEARIIQGTSGELTTFTDSSRQESIDRMIKSWNDAIDELYQIGTFKGEVATDTFTLVTGTREYSLASDFEEMTGDPVEPTNNNVLKPYPGGWPKMRVDQPDPDDYEGRPRFWTLNEVTGDLRIDTNPTSDENGEVYTYVYEKRINLSAITDTFPFSDDVADALESAAVQLFNRTKKTKFDDVLFQKSLARAAQRINRVKRRTTYGPRRRVAA